MKHSQLVLTFFWESKIYPYKSLKNLTITKNDHPYQNPCKIESSSYQLKSFVLICYLLQKVWCINKYGNYFLSNIYYVVPKEWQQIWIESVPQYGKESVNAHCVAHYCMWALAILTSFWQYITAAGCKKPWA